ncbi:MAG: hypothetical protein WBA97_29950 [Actinophytocola sp.]|uniref:hypothetical protein n=1 Tax=Actinophytocola sp. TaxID=1872138 RepID=UPI003C73A6AE
MDGILSGDALDPYRTPQATTCWWCGSTEPLTHEHKFKKSDLSRMGSADELVWGGDELRKIRSIRKSKDVRFNASLCARCNNTASQPFDNAYDVFSEFSWSNTSLKDAEHVDWWDVYGSNWQSGSLNLARYAVKHMGCRIVHDGYAAPDSLRSFLAGAPTTEISLGLVKSSEHLNLYLMGVRDGIETRGLWNPSAGGSVSRSRQCLTGYWSATIIGFVGIAFLWEEGQSAAEYFHTQRVKPLRLH